MIVIPGIKSESSFSYSLKGISKSNSVKDMRCWSQRWASSRLRRRARTLPGVAFHHKCPYFLKRHLGLQWTHRQDITYVFSSPLLWSKLPPKCSALKEQPLIMSKSVGWLGSSGWIGACLTKGHSLQLWLAGGWAALIRRQGHEMALPFCMLPQGYSFPCGLTRWSSPSSLSKWAAGLLTQCLQAPRSEHFKK